MAFNKELQSLLQTQSFNPTRRGLFLESWTWGGGALHKIHKNDDFLPKTRHNIKHIQSFQEKSKKSGWRHHDVTMTS